MTIYVVTCQNASGCKVETKIVAKSDEEACASALRDLNSWRAIRALPAHWAEAREIVIENVDVERAVPVYAPLLEQIREWDNAPSNTASAVPAPIRRTGVRDWVKYHEGSRANGAVGDALLEAAKEIA